MNQNKSLQVQQGGQQDAQQDAQEYGKCLLKIRAQRICAQIVTSAFLLGMFVCVICDRSITGTYTWSLLCVASIVFSWLILIPVIRYGYKGITGSIVMLSLFVIPFLYVLSVLLDADSILSVGIRVSMIGIVFLWMVYTLFKKYKRKKMTVLSISLLLGMGASYLIKLSLFHTVGVPVWQTWDFIGYTIAAGIAVSLFATELLANPREFQ